MTPLAAAAAAWGRETWRDNRDADEQSRGSVSVAPPVRAGQAAAAAAAAAATLPLVLPCPSSAVLPAVLSPAASDAAVTSWLDGWTDSSPASALNLDKLTQEMTACAFKETGHNSLAGVISDTNWSNWLDLTP